MSCFEKNIYPFTAIIGQEKMKKALVLNVINPRIGGVLIKGEKGTAKTTAVRALAALMPEVEVVSDCRFNCHPADVHLMCSDCRKRFVNKQILPVKRKKTTVINLPVSATEDRVVGTIDIEAALKNGEKKFEPGILAGAHRNILYVDEVNLLDDHVVDVLLDAAAMGVNIVEREGISIEHPSQFVLVGTMNPEEGDLRPQLLDRFGLCVVIEGIENASERVEIIKGRLSYEDDPHAFSQLFQAAQHLLREKILKAKEILPCVSIDDKNLALIAGISIEMGVDGHRSDIAMVKTAKTIAAYHLRDYVNESDIKESAELVLTHRMKRMPFEHKKMDNDKLEDIIKNQSRQPSNQTDPRDEKKKIMNH